MTPMTVGCKEADTISGPSKKSIIMTPMTAGCKEAVTISGPS